jgi:hypothetical protein
VPPGIRTQDAGIEQDLGPCDRYPEENDLRQDPGGFSVVRQEDLESDDAAVRMK